MKEKILKYLIYIAGFFCLYVFISIRVLPMYNSLMTEKLYTAYWDFTRYGELYYFDLNKLFREENMPTATAKHQFSQRQPDINDAEIFTFGDSFFDISRANQFPSVLAQKLGKKVYFGYDDYPLRHLHANGYTDKRPKVLIMETVERFIPRKYSKPRDTLFVHAKRKPSIVDNIRELKNIVFYTKSEIHYDALLKRSFLTTAAYSEISTLKFRLFGYISSFTPVYHLNDTIPWLFGHDEVNTDNTSFYYPHTQKDIDNMCNNIKHLSDLLKEKHNIHLVFLPMPAKYTIYHKNINSHKYNNFLPKLQEGLKARGVAFIDAYTELKNTNDLLYYGTDAHWNEKGMRFTVDLTIKYLRNNNLIN